MAKSTATETVEQEQAAETVDSAQTDVDAQASGEEATAGSNGGAQRFALPDGKVTPIQLKNELVKRGLAPKDIKPQQFYTYVKNPGKQDPFPVMHYDEDGQEYGTAQINEGETRAWTRPGLDLEAGVEWWTRRKERVGTSGKPGSTGKPADATATPVAGVPEQDVAEDFNEAE
jgi:hypothetical protein